MTSGPDLEGGPQGENQLCFVRKLHSPPMTCPHGKRTLRTKRESRAVESKALGHPTQFVGKVIAEEGLCGSSPGQQLGPNLHKNTVKHGTTRPVAMKCSSPPTPIVIHHSPWLLMTHQMWEPGFRATVGPTDCRGEWYRNKLGGCPPAWCPRLSPSPHGGSSPDQACQCVSPAAGGHSPGSQAIQMGSTTF